MINRILIRIKVLQIVYSYYQNGNGDLKVAENELLFSLQKSYDLYHYLLLLIVELTQMERRIQETRKNKYMPTVEDLNPDMRLVNNRFTAQLADNLLLQKYQKEQGISWADDEAFLKGLLEQIKASELYADYVRNPEDNYETDREFWRAAFKKLICGSEFVEEYLEDKSIYWNDDIEIVETFVLKSIKQFEEAKGAKQPLLPMFKDAQDKAYAVQLFRKTLVKGQEYRELIEQHLRNWESERIASMDFIIMQMAVAELVNFPSIPTNVTMNEYIDLAKHYSTPKSGNFINGVLDSVTNQLKKEGKLLK